MHVNDFSEQVRGVCTRKGYVGYVDLHFTAGKLQGVFFCNLVSTDPLAQRLIAALHPTVVPMLEHTFCGLPEVPCVLQVQVPACN